MSKKAYPSNRILKEKSKIPADFKALKLKSMLCGFIAGDGNITIRKQKNSLRYDLRFFPDDKIMVDKYLLALNYLYFKKPKAKFKKSFFEIQLTSRTAVEDLIKIGKFGINKWTVPFNYLINDEL